MIEVLSIMKVIEWIAKDLHYRSSGNEFYALHLLADKIEFDSEDELIEAHFLGNGLVPPTQNDIALLASKAYGYISSDGTNTSMLKAIYERCDYLVHLVEQVKRGSDVCAGVHAILDGISQNALVFKGLCARSIA